MPKRQSTAAQRARQRQATTGERYTAALRPQYRGPVEFQMFSPRGAGWGPIIRQAERELDEVWPDHPRPHWEEKFGELCWKYADWSQPGVPEVLRRAFREAAAVCQTCPSPGRLRVIWIWEGYIDGWLCPWVKNCCDACYYCPPHLRNYGEYRWLFEEYEEPNAPAT